MPSARPLKEARPSEKTPPPGCGQAPNRPLVLSPPGSPFRSDEDRRFLLRCELDAAFFRLNLGASSEWGVASGEDANGISSSSHSPFATNHSPGEASSEKRMARGKDAGVSSSSSHSPFATHRSPLLSAFPTPRHAVSYIMDTFPIVKRKDESKHGTYRTKATILQIYDALGESMASGVPYQTRLSPVPTDPRIAHMPKLQDIPRTVFAGQEYFEVVLPLLLRMAPEGLERARLFHAIDLLTDPAKRTKAARSLGEAGTQWAQTFQETYRLADAGKALITEVTKGRIRGVERMHLEPGAAITASNPWLCVDAFLALRLALEAEAAAAQVSEKAQYAIVEQIIKLAQVA